MILMTVSQKNNHFFCMPYIDWYLYDNEVPYLILFLKYAMILGDFYDLT